MSSLILIGGGGDLGPLEARLSIYWMLALAVAEPGSPFSQQGNIKFSLDGV